ncbi:phosphosulfolactate synthase [Halegenticoccus tardaugens]|uniref:phosphosulfolactate synthase n=1 Tax=Halegenticoccus tardaugens TaxID=2071624 RepID=UPI00100B4FB2|nr:phosphosulfolactate synthase [Halegenticoccus tardaugens]
MAERAFDFLRVNEREGKPREKGITEIRGPYYDPMGPRELRDVLETMGRYVDIYKFSGGSFALMDREVVEELIGICHEHDVQVSTGGFIEHVLIADHDQVDRYIEESKEIGFDIVEISSGFLAIDTEDLVALTEQVTEAGLKAKPEINVQFGAGGASSVEELESEAAIDPGSAIEEAKRHLDAGAYKIMVESEGITERVREWRTDVAFEIANEVGIEHCVFEAADPEVFEWYIKNFGPKVNLFVDNSQIVELECMRSGLWGKKSSWGRITSYTSE